MNGTARVLGRLFLSGCWPHPRFPRCHGTKKMTNDHDNGYDADGHDGGGHDDDEDDDKKERKRRRRRGWLGRIIMIS